MRGLMRTLVTWAGMIKLEHSVFALPFALLATFLAARPRLPSATQLGLIVVCMVAARSAAMTFNRLVDTEIDARNPRTADRALPRGLITRRAAWAFLGLSCALFFVGCAGFWLWSDNPWPLRLATPVLAWLLLYSYTKRFTLWSHIVLGVALALSPVGAWLAINPGTLGLPAVLLLVGVTFWVAGFDIIYACQDADFDRAHGLYSLPARIGLGPALWLARLCHVLTVAALIGVGLLARLGTLYYAGVACVAVLLTVENALVSPTDLRRVNVAFFTVNGFVGLLLALLGILDVVLS